MTAENDKDRVQKLSFEEALLRLSDLQGPRPLDPELIDLKDLKNKLNYSGIRLNLIETNQELSKSIRSNQFRSFDSGRGPAFVEALGGMDNAQKYHAWAYLESSDLLEIVRGDQHSRSRGLMQFAADTIALATNNMTVEEYCQKTNWRVGKEYKHDPIVASRFFPPTSDGHKKIKETLSIPEGSAIGAFRELVSLNKKRAS